MFEPEEDEIDEEIKKQEAPVEEPEESEEDMALA